MSNIPAIIIQDIVKYYVMSDGTKLRVLDNINLNVEQSEFICILGYSGCGKTTLLRIVCGFEKADSGVILIDGVRHEKTSSNVLMMFQDFNQAFPWKTVLQNVVYSLRVVDPSISKEEARRKALKRIMDVGLQDFINAYPHQLSGGMKQRVAVARALALQPRVLLMDEPFAALDSITRSSLQDLTRRVCDKYGVTVLFVTHSVEEAVKLATRIVVMDQRPGKIECVLNNMFRQKPEPELRFQLIMEITNLMDKLKGDGQA